MHVQKCRHQQLSKQHSASEIIHVYAFIHFAESTMLVTYSEMYGVPEKDSDSIAHEQTKLQECSAG